LRNFGHLGPAGWRGSMRAFSHEPYASLAGLHGIPGTGQGYVKWALRCAIKLTLYVTISGSGAEL